MPNEACRKPPPDPRDEKIAMLREALKESHLAQINDGTDYCRSSVCRRNQEILDATAQPEQPKPRWLRKVEAALEELKRDRPGYAYSTLYSVIEDEKDKCTAQPEQEGGWRSMEAEIELCARDLPEGAEVAVMVERGSAWVQASNWDNNHWDDSGYPDHFLAERIALARQWCIETEPPTRTEAEGGPDPR